METKLIQTKDYLLLIGEEVEIKKNDLVWHPLLKGGCIINSFWDNPNSTCSKIIAYYPLTKEAKELNLPLLPSFEEDKYIKDLAQQRWGNVHRTGVLGFIEGYKAAQSKQFSLEDMKKAIEMAREQDCSNFEYYGFCEKAYTDDEIIQSLSTQQLPKEFTPEYTYDHDQSVLFPKTKTGEASNKTITNSEGKQELVGRYKY